MLEWIHQKYLYFATIGFIRTEFLTLGHANLITCSTDLTDPIFGRLQIKINDNHYPVTIIALTTSNVHDNLIAEFRGYFLYRLYF